VFDTNLTLTDSLGGSQKTGRENRIFGVEEMDALYFRVSSQRQTTENQFEDLLSIAEKDGSGRDWARIREMLSRCVMEEHRASANGSARVGYRLTAELAAQLADQCVYVEQGRSSKIGARQRPLFERMKRDAAVRKFDRLLV
jgi:hypothetical protein